MKTLLVFHLIASDHSDDPTIEVFAEASEEQKIFKNRASIVKLSRA